LLTLPRQEFERRTFIVISEFVSAVFFSFDTLLLAFDCPALDAVVRGSTTPRQTEHNTDLTIHYAWHPWVGQTVQMAMPFDRGPELCFRVDRVEGKKTKRMDIPAWMFDRATCAAMITPQSIPYVTYEMLRRLRDLIRTNLADGWHKPVEQEHLPLPRQGNAHEKPRKSQAQSRTAKPVRRTTKTPQVDRVAKPRTKTSKRSDRTDAC
jgi:hypothetical protein